MGDAGGHAGIQAGVVQRHRAAQTDEGRLDLYVRLGQRKLDALVFADRVAEHDPFFGVGGAASGKEPAVTDGRRRFEYP